MTKDIASTLRAISGKIPHFDENVPVVGKYLSYPKSQSQRICEGGLRLEGKFKKSQQDMPLVTIITVCLNAEATLENTLQSVFEQNYDNIESIVIDGASKDNSLKIIESHKDKIDYYLSEEDEGIYYAMNKGLALASGDYILILNADDTYTSDAVFSLVRAKEESNCDFVSAHAYFAYEDSSKNYTYNRIAYTPVLSFCMPIRHETMLISAELYNEMGFYDTNYTIIADWVFCKKLFDAKKTMYELRKTVMNFSMKGISNTNQTKLKEERLSFVQKNFPFANKADLEILLHRDTLSASDFYTILAKYSHHFDFAEAMRVDPVLFRFYKMPTQ